jgi:hypothetical protein
MESFGNRFQIGSNRPEDAQVAAGDLPDRGKHKHAQPRPKARWVLTKFKAAYLECSAWAARLWQCPLPGVQQKTFAHFEVYRF